MQRELLQPWQQRVVEERNELQQRLAKLELMVAGRSLQAPSRALLVGQGEAMLSYLQILNTRIILFTRA